MRWARAPLGLTVAALLLLSLLLRGAGARAPLVEHRVGREDALRAARRLDSPHHAHAAGLRGGAAPAPGCQPCSRAELLYCAGADVMHDHCCCDMRYHEAFPFVPHTCYLRETPCAPLAADCQDYERLRACCCDDLLRQRWSTGAPATAPPALAWLLVAPLLLTALLLQR